MYATYYLIPGSCALACLLVILLLRHKSSSLRPAARYPAAPTIHKDCRHIEEKSSSYNYVQRFLRSRVLLQHRHAVYIDTDVHDTLWRVVRACGVRNITLSSYIDAIVREHLERYRTQIEALHAPADENSRTRCPSFGAGVSVRSTGQVSEDSGAGPVLRLPTRLRRQRPRRRCRSSSINTM